MLTWRICDDSVHPAASAPWALRDIKREIIKEPVSHAVLRRRAQNSWNNSFPLGFTTSAFAFGSFETLTLSPHLAAIDVRAEDVCSPMGARVQQRPGADKRVVDDPP